MRDALKSVAGYQGAEAGDFTARRRHLDALARAERLFALAEARLGERSAFELVAEELRQAQRALGEITGEMTSDELLGTIFGHFCIGKLALSDTVRPGPPVCLGGAMEDGR